MTSGPVPTNSQKAGWSLYAERIVARSTSVKANPKPLISPAVQFSLIGLFIESRSEYRPSSTGLLSGSCAACRSFAEKGWASCCRPPACAPRFRPSRPRKRDSAPRFRPNRSPFSASPADVFMQAWRAWHSRPKNRSKTSFPGRCRSS